jgi:hypothetical protein
LTIFWHFATFFHSSLKFLEKKMATRYTYNPDNDTWDNTGVEIPLPELAEMFVDFLFNSRKEEGQKIEISGDGQFTEYYWRRFARENHLGIFSKDFGEVMNFLFNNGQIELKKFGYYGNVILIILRQLQTPGLA